MSRVIGDLVVTGNLSAGGLYLSSSVVSNAQVAAGANVDANKLQHQHRALFEQPNTAATSETKAVHVAKASGTVEAFVAGSIVAPIGGATVTVDLKKNGTTVLTAVITLDNGNTAYVVEAGTVSVSAYVAGDVFTVVTVATTGGGTLPTGVFAAATFNENPA